MKPAAERATARSFDEKNLVEGLIGQREAAVADFLERSHHAVYGLASRLTRNTDDRRDWTHEVLIGILDDLKGGKFVYRRPGSFWAWFRKRAYFRLLDQYRRNRARHLREGSGVDELTDLDLEPFGAKDSSAEFHRVEILSAIEECLNQMSSRSQRMALELLLFEDMAYQDISDSLSSPLNTVRAWIRRGRLALRRCLMERWKLSIERAGE